MKPELDLGHLQQRQQQQWTLPMLNYSPEAWCNQIQDGSLPTTGLNTWSRSGRISGLVLWTGYSRSSHTSLGTLPPQTGQRIVLIQLSASLRSELYKLHPIYCTCQKLCLDYSIGLCSSQTVLWDALKHLSQYYRLHLLRSKADHALSQHSFMKLWQQKDYFYLWQIRLGIFRSRRDPFSKIKLNSEKVFCAAPRL